MPATLPDGPRRLVGHAQRGKQLGLRAEV
eukprot:COSAG06_NODE_37288_length_437_cov_0.612426_1_plen_28_part_01